MTTLDTRESPRRLQNIKRVSRLMAAACLVLIAVLPIGAAGYWVWADTTELAVRADLAPDSIQAPLKVWQRVVGALITGVPLALMLFGLWQARNCFNLFASGKVFTAQAVQYLRRFSFWVLASTVAGLIVVPAISVLLTYYNEPGTRQLAISFGSDQVFVLFAAGMVWLMAAIIGQGLSLAEENANFI